LRKTGNTDCNYKRSQLIVVGQVTGVGCHHEGIKTMKEEIFDFVFRDAGW